MNRKEKEREFYNYHLEKFNNLKITEPLFVVKTAFFQKGKYGKHFQLFESELKRGEDIYIEFIEIVRDNSGNDINITPANENRDLFKFKYNPYFFEEYETKESNNTKGESYTAFVIPLSELLYVLDNGDEINYSLYEKRKEEKKNNEDKEPKLQSSLSIFPDFEEKELKITDMLKPSDDTISNMTIKDFAAILWKKPISSKEWLNNLINKI